MRDPCRVVARLATRGSVYRRHLLGGSRLTMTVDSGPIPTPFDDENNDCPKRGVALSHMRIPYITVPTCQFCDVRLVLGRTTDGNLTPPNTEMPTFDVAARLRQLGMMPGGSQETKAESSGLD